MYSIQELLEQQHQQDLENDRMWGYGRRRVKNDRLPDFNSGSSNLLYIRISWGAC